MYERKSLLYRLRDIDFPIVLISGFPGSGKTRTLEMFSQLLDVEIQDHFQGADELREGERVVIDSGHEEDTFQLDLILKQLPKIKRKKAKIYLGVGLLAHPPSLSIHLLYKNVAILSSQDLFFSIEEIRSLGIKDSETLYEQTAGWPILVDYAERLNEPLFLSQWQHFVAVNLLSVFPFKVVRSLVALAFSEGIPQERSGLSESEIESLSPILQVELGGKLRLGIPMLKEPLRKFARKNGRYHQQAMRIVAKSHHDAGRTTLAITEAAQSSNYDLAIRWFEESGDSMFGCLYGYAALNTVLAVMPAPIIEGNIYLCWAVMLSKLKSGDNADAIAMFEAIKSKHINQQPILGLMKSMLDPFRSTKPTEISCKQLEKLHPIFLNNSMYLGVLHNELCANYIDLEQYEKASISGEIAYRAYRDARAPYLQFFICLHMSNICIELGKLDDAQQQVNLGRDCLKAVSFADELYNEKDMLYLEEARIALLKGNLSLAYDLWKSAGLNEGGREMWTSMMKDYCWSGVLIDSLSTGSVHAGQKLDALKADYWQVMGDSYAREFELIQAYLLQQQGHWHQAEQSLDNYQTQRRDNASGRDKLFQLIHLRNQVSSVARKNRPSGKELHQLIAQIERESDQPNDGLSSVFMRLHLCRLHIASNHEGLAQTALKEAVTLAIQTGIRLPFIMESEWVLPPLKNLLSIRLDGSQISIEVQSIIPLIVKAYESEHIVRRSGPFSTKETLILSRLNEGMTNKQIARHQGISENTVKYHLKQMYLRAGCHSRQQLLYIAREQRWV
ncbi:LuxR C-terminal-related transcriptional regulator [Vibrio penaeicida]|uniref:LuxR C-terminal-related transcriptional regulator n=1 Tax=Vibrio penaeicida TaxID=104609 RepID=UPI000CE9E4DB|nr:LuxR C-terminal-related transcriptional regulator [Vibrio penaeicida]